MSRESQAARLSISPMETRQAEVADRVPVGWDTPREIASLSADLREYFSLSQP